VPIGNTTLKQAINNMHTTNHLIITALQRGDTSELSTTHPPVPIGNTTLKQAINKIHTTNHLINTALQRGDTSEAPHTHRCRSGTPH